MTATNNNQNNF